MKRISWELSEYEENQGLNQGCVVSLGEKSWTFEKSKRKEDFDVLNKVELLSNYLNWSYPFTMLTLTGSISSDLMSVLDLRHPLINLY